MPTIAVVILAAGQGSRMKSSLPKVLHRLADKPLLRHVIDRARDLTPTKILVVYGHGGEQVRATIPDADLIWVEQTEQLGTGHAVQQVIPYLEGVDQVLVLYGDVPLVSSQTLRQLLQISTGQFGLLTVTLPDPTGYGRIERDDNGEVLRIIEQKDANPTQRAIQEINTGMMSLPARRLTSWLGQLSNDNAQKEYYLTDVLAMAVAEGMAVKVTQPAQAVEAEGVNNKMQLAALERAYQRMQADQLMADGLMLLDPARFDLRGTLTHGRDCVIDVNVIVEGRVQLGDNVHVGANTVLRDAKIADHVTILENCVIEGADIGADSRIGPFSRLRPGTQLTGAAHIGNFVEIKKSQVDQGSKINHLSYIGDSQIGAGVNVGAGTITCNYDGANKHQTVIQDDAFIGSNTALVAPVTIQQGATIGAGSVISRDAPAEQLTLTRAKQSSLQWQRPKKPT